MKKSELKKMIKEEIKSLVEDYNGWKNWDTWNANLWLNNEKPVYKALMRSRSAGDVKQLFLSTFGKGHDNININKVDWQEIFDDKEDE